MKATPLGTHERFIGFLIEHYAGNFPLWLAPDQVRVITIGDDEALVNYSKQIVNELRANMVRVSADFGNNPINSDKSRAGPKIQDAEQEESYPPPHVGGYGSSSAAAIWRLTTSRCAGTAKARKARSRKRKRGGYSGGDSRAAHLTGCPFPPILSPD